MSATSAPTASQESASVVIATVSAPAARACASISMVSSVRPVFEMPTATQAPSCRTALVRPSCTSDQECAFTPIL